MTVRPPRQFAPRRAPDNPQTALEYEIAQEKASTLGRLGRRLEEALAALAAFDASAHDWDHDWDTAGAGHDPATRPALVAEAGVALWHFVVQREALGLRDVPRVLKDYQVPDEVRDRMGAFPLSPKERRK